MVRAVDKAEAMLRLPALYTRLLNVSALHSL